MTKDEFWQSYKVLNKKYPLEYPLQDAIKLRVFYDMVKDLDVRWFNRVIARAVLKNDAKFDFRAAAAGELRAIREVNKTKDLVNQVINVSESGLENYLSSLGVDSLVKVIK